MSTRILGPKKSAHLSSSQGSSQHTSTSLHPTFQGSRRPLGDSLWNLSPSGHPVPTWQVGVCASAPEKVAHTGSISRLGKTGSSPNVLPQVRTPHLPALPRPQPSPAMDPRGVGDPAGTFRGTRQPPTPHGDDKSRDRCYLLGRGGFRYTVTMN